MGDIHRLEPYADATPDVIEAIIDEAGKLAAEILQPTNVVGDRQPCSYDPSTHSVSTPDGFREAGGAHRQEGGTHWHVQEDRPRGDPPTVLLPCTISIWAMLFSGMPARLTPSRSRSLRRRPLSKTRVF